MNPLTFINELKAQGATFMARGDKLRVEAPAGVLTADHTKQLRRSKKLILAALSGHRVTLAEYGAILNEAVTGPDLPPLPPYRFGEPEHAAAWSCWWSAVEALRAHRGVSR